MADQDSSAPFLWKLKWFALIVGTLYSGYQVTNRWQWREPTTLPLTWLDRQIPFLEWTVWPYLLLAGCIFLLLLLRDRFVFRYSLAAMIFGYSINLVVFTLWPTMLPREGLPDGLHGAGFQWLYSIDTAANCFPSGHITAPLIAFYALTLEHPTKRRWLWLTFGLLCPTILTTRQHYAIDLFGGLATGIFGLWAARLWMGEADGSPTRPTFNGGVINLIRFQRDPLRFFQEVTAKCGPVVKCRLAWLNLTIVNDPEAAHAVLRLPPGTSNKKTRSVDLLKRIAGQSLLTANDASWFTKRRLLQPAFHHLRLQAYAKDIRRFTEEAVADWQTAPGARIEVNHAMRQLTFRIICRLLLGTESPGETREVERSISRLLSTAWHSIQSPLDLHWRLSGSCQKQFAQDLALVRGFILERVVQRRRDQADTGDLISMLIAVRDADTGQGMTDEEIVTECLTLLIAGYDTTANALIWAMVLLAEHPEVGEQLREEISTGDTPHARAVFMEVLRLYPPIWLIERNIESAVTVGRWKIDAGSQVLICPWALHRSPGHWQEPERFDPSRFLGTGSEPAAWLAFGAGPRVCIGRGLAMLEGQIILNAIAQAGRFVLESGPPKPDPGIALRPEGDVWMRFESASH